MLLAAVAVLWLAVCAGAAAAANLAGSVVGLGGAVTLERDGQRYAPRIGDPVYTDDTVEVPAGARLKLRMNDGSILALAPGTVMRIDTYTVDASGQRRSALLSVGQGLLRSITSETARPAPFEVNTAVGISGVRSTDWFVEALTGYQQVAVLSGSVQLTSRTTGRGVIVPAGSGTRLDAGADPASPRPLSQAEFASLIARTEGADSLPGGGYAPPPGPPPLPPPGYYPPGPAIQIPLFPGGQIRPDAPRHPGGRGDGRGPSSRPQ